METNLNKSIRKMALVNFLVWVTVLLTGAFSIWAFRSFDPEENIMEQGGKVLILINVSFVVSLGVSIFGLVYTNRFRKILIKHNISGGNFLVSSMCLMLISTLIGLQSIPGINLRFGFLAISEVRETVSSLSIFGVFSLVAMISFMVAVLLNFIGLYQIANGQKDKAAAVSGLEDVKKSSLILFIVVLLFSPVLVSYIAANTIKFENTSFFNFVTSL